MFERGIEKHFTLLGSVSLVIASFILSACGGSAGDDPDPTVNEQPIAYVKRPTPLDMNDNLVQNDLTDPTVMRPGAHLIVKSIASITATELDITDAIIGDTGDVRDPAFNYNGTKLVFSMIMEDDNMGDPETWDIWEYDLAKPLSQVAGPDQNPRPIMQSTDAIRGHELMPEYLPGNRVVFSSSMAARTGSVALDEGGTGFSPTIEAQDSDILAMNIHVINDDGTNLQQLTFNMSHDLDPSFIRNIPGLENHIMFSRWENFGENQMSVYAMRPDGTGLIHLYGAHSHATGTAGAIQHFSGPMETSSGQVLVMGRSFTNTFDGGDPVLLDVQNYVDNTIPANSNAGATGPGQTSVSGGEISTDNSLSLRGRYGSVIPMLDGTNRALASYSLCLVDINDPNTNTVIETRICSDPLVDLSNPDHTVAPPRYGVYVLDMGSNSILPVTTAQPDTYFTDLALGQGLANAGLQLSYSFDVVNTTPIGTIHIKSVYDLDGNHDVDLNGVVDGVGLPTLAQLIDDTQSTNDPVQFPALIERPAYFLRIVKGTFIPDDDVRDFDNSAYGLDRTGQLMRQIIGYAQIEPDGSVRADVPSDVPLSFSVVDRNGRRIGPREHEYWISVRPGEEVTCNGCHTHTGTPTAHGRQSATSPQLNAVPTALNNVADTSTYAHINTSTNGKTPSVHINYVDNFTVNRAADNSFTYDYSDVNTTKPLNYAGCEFNWDEKCRIVINYPNHIQPIWEFARVDSGATSRQCTSCHTTYDAVNAVIQVPDGKYQLDLTQNSPDGGGNSIDIQDPDYFKSYIELLGPDNILEVQGANLVDSGFDDDMDPMTPDTPRSVFFGTGLVEIINSGTANGSTPFFEVFTEDYYNTYNGVPGRMPHWDPGANGGAGGAWLTPGELKIISEWIDIGAQYYNDPFAAPLN